MTTLSSKRLPMVLEDAGHRVSGASDGKTALRNFADDPPDLVITDIYMPQMDGIELLVRLHTAFPEAKVICISGGGYRSAADLLEASKNLGAVMVLTKPIQPKDLIRAVEETLES